MGGVMPGRIASFFRNLLRKRAIEQALDDELKSTVELLAQEKMKQGLSHPEARRQAVIELGGVEQVKEEVRAIRSGMFLETFAQDLRYRSEERRVGKECRSRWSRNHIKRKQNIRPKTAS